MAATPATFEIPLYEDRYVLLTEDALVLKTFYFPTGAPKTIPRSDIDRVWAGTDPELGLSTKYAWKKKSWGIGFSNIWWACRMGREFETDNTSEFVVSTKGGPWFRSGFSVEVPVSFAPLVEEYTKNA